MSTNARINLMVSGNTKTLKLKPELLPFGIKRNATYEEWRESGKTVTDVELDALPSHVIRTRGKKYVSIYHHWDGYPSSLGRVLCKHFSTYEAVASLMALGDCSTICGHGKNARFICPYLVREGEIWRNIQPQLHDEVMDDMQYNYVFEDGRWYVIYRIYNGRKIVKKDLKKLLKLK